MKIKVIFLSLLAIFMFLNCEKEPAGSTDGSQTNTGTGGNGGNGGNNNPGNTGGQDQEWLIPEDEVMDGGPGKDGIPSVDDPQFSSVSAINFLSPDDLVIGFKANGEARSYPHPVMDWHEITNDKAGGIPIAVTYCPLTGTALGWSGQVQGEVTTFGVSGLLYNNNLIPYDRKTGSNWSQIKSLCVNGNLKGTIPRFYHLVETTWEQWKKMYPNSKVMNRNTGYNRNYNQYPYGDYKSSGQLLFPVSNEDSRLHKKERVHGIIVKSKARIYRLKHFSGGVNVNYDRFQGKDIVLAGSRPGGFIVSFERGSDKNFQAIQTGGNKIMKDEEGNVYDLFGYIIEGPDKGSRLDPTHSFMGYWFSWAAFFPGVEIYQPRDH